MFERVVSSIFELLYLKIVLFCLKKKSIKELVALFTDEIYENESLFSGFLIKFDSSLAKKSLDLTKIYNDNYF